MMHLERSTEGKLCVYKKVKKVITIGHLMNGPFMYRFWKWYEILWLQNFGLQWEYCM